MEFIIETPLSPHMAGRTTRFIARDFFLLDTASRASRCKARRQSPSLVSWNTNGHLEQARSDLCPASSVSVRCVVVLFPRAKVPPWNRSGHLEQARIDLCPASSVKVGHFEQTRTVLCPAGSIKVGHLEQPRSACALPAQSKWTPCDCLVQSNKLYCSP